MLAPSTNGSVAVRLHSCVDRKVRFRRAFGRTLPPSRGSGEFPTLPGLRFSLRMKFYAGVLRRMGGDLSVGLGEGYPGHDCESAGPPPYYYSTGLGCRLFN
ncbi:hypothetical protein NL676_004289 [Syzygium grande]|nr:hypothetical protein NL676_004289 [Syzygium grande]